MNNTKTRRRGLAWAGTGGAAAALMVAVPALAAPYATQASATALYLSVVADSVVVDSTTETAANDGSEAEVTASEQPLISILAPQDVLEAGALGEVAVARNDGTSGACSGITGEGGTVEVGDPTACATPGDAPVTLNLAVVGNASARIEADAISATCEGNADGTTTGSANLVNARLVITRPVLPPLIVDIDTDVAPNTKLLDLLSPALADLLAPIVDVTLNQQVPLDPAEVGDGYYGGLSVTAISVEALTGALADAELANVTCGPSADLAIIPAVPAAGIPVALGTLAVLGAGGYLVTRRRGQRGAA